VLQVRFFRGHPDDDRDAPVKAGGLGNPLTFHQHPGGVFQQLLDVDQELHGLPSIHDAVVIAECHIHHRANDDLTGLYDRSFFDLMHPQNADLPLVLVSEVIKLLITIVGQISKFKFKYATGVRHSVSDQSPFERCRPAPELLPG
jgi:hypothetical protein